METPEELRARVERVVGEMAEVRSAWPDIGMEPRPKVRQLLAEEWRVFSEREAAVSRGWASATKGYARREGLHSERTRSVGATDVMERRSETAPERERPHWKVAAQHMRGEQKVYELPGGVIAMCKELGVERLMTLPMCDEMLAKADADLAPVVARLRTELDAWDARAVHASIDATLPAIESNMVASVDERD